MEEWHGPVEDLVGERKVREMKITPIPISGAFLLEQDVHCDERGTFSRQFCQRELANAGLGFTIRQCNISTNVKTGTLRGLHYQKDPYPEIKLVSCWSGSAFDALVDLRKDSPTYLHWCANELHGMDGKSIYIPAGVAHGFQTLADDTTIYYQLGEFFMPEYYDGVRWDDPAFGIVWPSCTQRIMNERDQHYADWLK